MPPFSQNLAEEGVLIRNFKLVAAGQSRLDELGKLLAGRPLSHAKRCRQPGRHLGPSGRQSAGSPRPGTAGRAVLAAGRRGLHGAHPAAPPSARCVPHSRDCPADRTASSTIWTTARRSSPRSTCAATRPRSTSPAPARCLAGNLNANRAIVTAAVMYVLRSLIDEDIPLNQGVLAPVRIVLPECLLNPTPGPTPERKRGRRGRQCRNVAARGRRAAWVPWEWPRPARER